MLWTRQKTVPSARKFMATVFWTTIILIDYLEKVKTITGQYYADLLDCFNAKLKEKHTICSRKKCFLIMTMWQCTCLQLQTLRWLNYHTNCSLIHPTLLTWPTVTFFFFQAIKKNGLMERDFLQILRSLMLQKCLFEEFGEKLIFLKGLRKLEHHWKKSIIMKENYVKK